MLKSSFVCAFALGAVLLVGCNKDETTPTPPPAPTNPPKQPQASGTGVAPAGEEMKKAANDTANKAADSAAKAGSDASKGLNDVARNTADAAKGTAEAAKSSATDAKASTDAAAAKATDSAAGTEAMSLWNQVSQYIKEKKFDDADAALKKLEGMQASLPDTIKTQLPTARKAIDAGKGLTGSGTPAAPSAADLPKVPGLNK
jgi:hypothetical protein